MWYKETVAIFMLYKHKQDPWQKQNEEKRFKERFVEVSSVLVRHTL